VHENHKIVQLLIRSAAIVDVKHFSDDTTTVEKKEHGPQVSWPKGLTAVELDLMILS